MKATSIDVSDVETRPVFVLEMLRQQQQQQQEIIDSTRNVTMKQNNEVNKNDEPFLYYFGVGSNMLRSKIETRGVNGSTIEILDIEPAFVKGHRLAFNMRGFPPLEPGMGSLEPVNSNSKALYPYEDGSECHGALVKVTVENYEKIMRSEGVGYNSTDNPFGPNRRNDIGYEEVVVTAIPYDGTKQPVTAIALRAKSGSRLTLDACPSKRYMDILQKGASELGLVSSYQQYLQNHPIQSCPKMLRLVSVLNFLFLGSISTIFKTRVISQIQSWLLFRVYVRARPHGTETILSKIQQVISLQLTGLILLPGASVGLVIGAYLRVFNKPLPIMIQRLAKSLQDQQDVASSNNSTST